jgi:ABC-type cobalamin/Fe3+-siderophores transport system ATPase subunit
MFSLLDLAKQEGKTLMIMGPAGCGKSTLARQLSPGTVEIHASDLYQKFNGFLDTDIIIIDTDAMNPSSLATIKTILRVDVIAISTRGKDLYNITPPTVILVGYEALDIPDLKVVTLSS